MHSAQSVPPDPPAAPGSRSQRWSRLAVVVGSVLVLMAGALGALWLRSGGGSTAGVTPTASASTGPTPDTMTGPAARPGGSGAVLRDIDGGLGYYGNFVNGLPTNESFFPVGVWFESVVSAEDIEQDKDAGLNVYVELTASSDLGLVRRAGMHAFVSQPTMTDGPLPAAWLITDEVDMWGGPGRAEWTGKDPESGEQICVPENQPCGYSALAEMIRRLPDDGRMHYANFGKGIAFWQADAEAREFVNAVDGVVSADTYWLTDNNICSFNEGGEFFDGREVPDHLCHRPANYGLTVDRVRELVRPAASRPVWAFVEVGHPFSEDHWPSAEPAAVSAAVWSSLIHGARGIIYFNHSFGGPCQTQHALRESCYREVRAEVKRTNARIHTLAPVLNAPFADGVAEASEGADLTTKWHGGHFYVLANATDADARPVTFTLSCVGDATVTVLFENRTIDAPGGVFTDNFADLNAVHLYRVEGGSSCGAY